MRHIIIILLYFFCQSIFAANIALQDSLLQQLARSTTPKEKAGILRNLADVYFELPQEQEYLRQLITMAQKMGDHELLINSLSDMANCHLDLLESDSAQYYIDQIRKIENPPTDLLNCQLTYLKMRMFGTKVKKGSNSSIEAINQELKKTAAESKNNKSIYEKIADAYIIAYGFDAQDKYKEAIPYSASALNMAATLPFKEGIFIRMLIMRMLKIQYIANEQYDKVIPLVEEYIELQEKHYQQFLEKDRPFYPIESFRIADYTTLIINIRYLSPQKAHYYLQRIMDMSNKTNRPKDKYTYFLAINNYYLFKEDYPKALASNDSLIEYAKILAPYNVPGLYNVNSQIYEAMGKYKDALYALRTSHVLQDSLTSAKSLEQLNKLQVQYDLNKLNYENSQLEVKNKQIMLISLSIVLLISIIISVYLNYNLKKEKAMKAHLRILKIKAEESENMKTSFINSICHEIRTPLNSIVGFTDLIFNESIDEELRRTFPEEIQRNTQLLTGLISSMLEVSNLDVSDEKLPCEPADIHTICHNEIDRIKMTAKPDINYLLDIPTEPLIISTNAQYLALVIEHLLNNANKFTTSGSVTLKYHIDKATNYLLISVTDTGMGIPEEKHEEIFDRFTKLDSFVSGNGLGLYLCRLIVKRLSGTIAVDGTYKEGTRIIVSLPA